MSSIKIKKISITNINVDAVVNAANLKLLEGGGVCGYIFEEAGAAEMTKACNQYGHCDTGSAVITPGFRLPAKYVIHAVGPRWIDGKHGEPRLLYSAYATALRVALENDIHSIGFPLLSAGIFGYPKMEAWKVAISACRDFLAKNTAYDLDIIFAVLDDNIMSMGQHILENPESALNGTMCKEVQASTVKHLFSEQLVKVFEDTMDWIKADPELSASIPKAIKSTKVYYEDNYPLFNRKSVSTSIAVSKDKSYQAAMRLAKEYKGKKIAVMNFANAYHAGGGVTKGAPAQEESLCRTSTLYPVLSEQRLKETFYKHNKKHREIYDTSKATDAIIYTEGVIICKTDDKLPQRMPKEDWVTVDIITIAAPDLRPKSNLHAEVTYNGSYMSDAELFAYHVKRAIHMLAVAASQGAEVLVLGAFGCGAFQNNPKVVAKAYKVALDEFPNMFDHIEFAIYCTPDKMENYDSFKAIFDAE